MFELTGGELVSVSSTGATDLHHDALRLQSVKMRIGGFIEFCSCISFRYIGEKTDISTDFNSATRIKNNLLINITTGKRMNMDVDFRVYCPFKWIRRPEYSEFFSSVDVLRLRKVAQRWKKSKHDRNKKTNS